MDETLSMYSNGDDVVIALDATDAAALTIEAMGYDPDEVATFRVVDDTRAVTIGSDDGPTTMTAREWVANEGRGHVASVNEP